MKRRAIILVALLALLSGCGNSQPGRSPFAQTLAGSAPAIARAGWVTDAAGLLTAQQNAEISTKLARFQQATSHQIVVVTVPTLGGQNVDGFTLKLFNQWGIGRKGINDGVVVLVAPREHKARITIGYGLEKTLSNAQCKDILERQMIPRFRVGDWAGGIDAGTNALIAKLPESLGGR